MIGVLMLALVCNEVHAQAPPTAVPVASQAAGWTAVLRAEYIAGERILVPLLVRNDGAQPTTVPDLERRPWLVDFAFDAGKGELEHRRTKAPPDDPGHMLTVGPRGQRQTLLEVPTSGGLKAGRYEMLVSLLDGTTGEPSKITSSEVRIAPAKPVSADLKQSVGGADRSQLQAVWVHGATEGFDLYLHVADARRPDREQGSHFLAHLTGKVSPRLSHARGADVGNRHIVWMEGERDLGYVQLQGIQLRDAPKRMTLPWPKARLVASPMTDGAGALHVPVWIPAPNGKGGELRVVSFGDRGQPSFRRVSRYDTQPSTVVALVDDSGIGHVAVGMVGGLDLYTLRATSGHDSLPVPGRRLLRTGDGVEVVAAEFGVHPGDATSAGGLGVLAMLDTPEGLVPRWMGLQGAELRTLDPILAPEGNMVLRAVLPRGYDPPGLLFSDGDDRAIFVEGPRVAEAKVPLTGDWGVARASDGQAWLRRAVLAGPIAVSPL